MPLDGVNSGDKHRALDDILRVQIEVPLLAISLSNSFPTIRIVGMDVNPEIEESHMSVSSMEELFVNELKDVYSAEKQITKALPKMAKATSSPQLRAAFESHLQETLGQIDRLEKIFETLGKSPKGKVCHGMKGVIEEGAEVLEDTEKGDVRDAALISAAQRVEHYEMAAYGCVHQYAKILGRSDIATLLAKTLEEEKAADAKLGSIAGAVNSAALKAA